MNDDQAQWANQNKEESEKIKSKQVSRKYLTRLTVKLESKNKKNAKKTVLYN
jgi:hypothetical protein